MMHLQPKESYLLHSYLENSSHYARSLDPKYPEILLPERAQAALTPRKVMAESQAKSKFKCAIKHQSPKMQNYTYSPGEKVLVWREKIVNNRIEEFIGPFTVLHPDERCKIVAID